MWRLSNVLYLTSNPGMTVCETYSNSRSLLAHWMSASPPPSPTALCKAQLLVKKAALTVISLSRACGDAHQAYMIRRSSCSADSHWIWTRIWTWGTQINQSWNDSNFQNWIVLNPQVRQLWIPLMDIPDWDSEFEKVLSNKLKINSEWVDHWPMSWLDLSAVFGGMYQDFNVNCDPFPLRFHFLRKKTRRNADPPVKQWYVPHNASCS